MFDSQLYQVNSFNKVFKCSGGLLFISSWIFTFNVPVGSEAHGRLITERGGRIYWEVKIFKLFNS